MSNHHHPPEDRDWHEYQERLETHDYAIINNAIALIRTHCDPAHHWVCDRLLEVRHRAAYAETRLAEKERECERLREWRAAVIAANDDEPHCIYCRGFLDTGMECNDCGRDNMPFYRALENDDG